MELVLAIIAIVISLMAMLLKALVDFEVLRIGTRLIATIWGATMLLVVAVWAIHSSSRPELTPDKAATIYFRAIIMIAVAFGLYASICRGRLLVVGVLSGLIAAAFLLYGLSILGASFRSVYGGVPDASGGAI